MDNSNTIRHCEEKLTEYQNHGNTKFKNQIHLKHEPIAGKN